MKQGGRAVRGGRWFSPVTMVLVGLVLGCSAPSPQSGGGSETQQTSSRAVATAPKRLSAYVTSDLPTLRSQMNRAAGGILAGAPELEQIVHAGLAITDDAAVLRPELAEAVPSIENGLWKVFADGRMETSWKIREGAQWHDGTPFTADDLTFTARVFRDPEVPSLRTNAFDSIEKAEALDSRTLLITWRKPYISADTLFAAAGAIQALPLPKHIFEQPYQDNKAGIPDLPYWGDEFVGAGPFKVRDWVRGVSLTLDAFDRYALGRPKIDVIEVRFIPDPNTGMANLLSGAVQQPLGRGISFEQGLQLRDQWRDGKIAFAAGADPKVWPQFINPNPAILSDVRFRDAVYRAINRQEMVETLMAGQVEVAHTIIAPNDPEFRYIQDSIVKHEYDPRQSAQLIQSLGYVRGGDGMYRDGTGQPLVVEIRSSPMDILQKSKLAIADYWQTAGIGVTIVDDSPQMRGNLEYRATFPAFDTSRAGSGAEMFEAFLSSEARTPQNRYIGQNGSNYMNPELDTLVERYLTTIPYDDRMRAAAAVVHHMTEQIVVMDQFYDAAPTAVNNHLVNLSPQVARRGTNTWNVHLWDLTN